jgi:hypothetical protein
MQYVPPYSVGEVLFLSVGAVFAYGVYTVVQNTIAPLICDLRFDDTGLRVVLFRTIPVHTIPYAQIASAEATTQLRFMFGPNIGGGSESSLANRTKPLVVIRRRDRRGTLVITPRDRDAFLRELHARMASAQHQQHQPRD